MRNLVCSSGGVMVICVVYSIEYSKILNCYIDQKFRFERFDRYDQNIRDSNSYIGMFH